MSNYWHAVCLDHDPEVGDPDEFTQHTEDERWQSFMAAAASRPLPDEWYETPGLAGMWGARFLAAHPYCRLKAVSETGVHQKIPNGAARPALTDHCERPAEEGGTCGHLGHPGRPCASYGCQCGAREVSVTVTDPPTCSVCGPVEMPPPGTPDPLHAAAVHHLNAVHAAAESSAELPEGWRRVAVLTLSLPLLWRHAQYRVPAGARVRSVWASPERECVSVAVEHDSFDPVAPFAEAPRLAADDVSVEQLAADVLKSVSAVRGGVSSDVEQLELVRASVRQTLALLGVPWRP